jgi:hypothetical protein
MGIINKLEEAAAKKLRRIFLDADKCANYAADDVARLEKELESARIKAADESRKAYQSALEAADKAQKVANELMLEVKRAEERAIHYESQVENKK